MCGESFTSTVQSRHLSLFRHIARWMDDNINVKKIVFVLPPEGWKRLPGLWFWFWQVIHSPPRGVSLILHDRCDGLRLYRMTWNPTTLHWLRQLIWRRTAHSGGCWQRSALGALMVQVNTDWMSACCRQRLVLPLQIWNTNIQLVYVFSDVDVRVSFLSGKWQVNTGPLQLHIVNDLLTCHNKYVLLYSNCLIVDWCIGLLLNIGPSSWLFPAVAVF